MKTFLKYFIFFFVYFTAGLLGADLAEVSPAKKIDAGASRSSDSESPASKELVAKGVGIQGMRSVDELLAERKERSVNVGSKARGSEKKQKKTMAEMKALLKSEGVLSVEQHLSRDNTEKVGTAEWHTQTTNQLLALASAAIREGNGKSASQAITRSLQHLDDASRIALSENDKKRQAHAKLLSGVVHERFTGDVNLALAAYKSAIDADPDNESAKEAYDRLEQSLAILNLRVKAAKH